MPERLAAANRLPVVLLLAACCASAQDRTATLEQICNGEARAFSTPPLEVFDDDGDGTLTLHEASECDSLEELFSRLDLDGSGTLTVTEYESFADVWQLRARTFEDPPETDP